MRFITACLIVLLIPSAGWAQKVEVTHDHGVDFTSYQSFAWKQGTPLDNELTNQRITNAIENQLSILGLIEKAEGDADLHVVFHGSGEREVELRTADFQPPSLRTRTQTALIVVKGSIVVELIDAESEKLVWRAEAKETVTDQPNRIEKAIDKAVQKMFKKYPVKK